MLSILGDNLYCTYLFTHTLCSLVKFYSSMQGSPSGGGVLPIKTLGLPTPQKTVPARKIAQFFLKHLTFRTKNYNDTEIKITRVIKHDRTQKRSIDSLHISSHNKTDKIG